MAGSDTLGRAIGAATGNSSAQNYTDSAIASIAKQYAASSGARAAGVVAQGALRIPEAVAADVGNNTIVRPAAAIGSGALNFLQGLVGYTPSNAAQPAPVQAAVAGAATPAAAPAAAPVARMSAGSAGPWAVQPASGAQAAGQVVAQPQQMTPQDRLYAIQNQMLSGPMTYAMVQNAAQSLPLYRTPMNAHDQIARQSAQVAGLVYQEAMANATTPEQKLAATREYNMSLNQVNGSGNIAQALGSLVSQPQQ